VELIGTVRSFETDTRDAIWADIRNIAEHTAQAHHATAEVSFEQHTRVTRNDLALTERLRPALGRAAGVESLVEFPASTVAEDFAYFADEVPGFYFFVGSTAKGVAGATAPSNHSPKFHLDEGALPIGVNAMLSVVDQALHTP
jgi:amidohydrolase